MIYESESYAKYMNIKYKEIGSCSLRKSIVYWHVCVPLVMTRRLGRAQSGAEKTLYEFIK